MNTTEPRHFPRETILEDVTDVQYEVIVNGQLTQVIHCAHVGRMTIPHPLRPPPPPPSDPPPGIAPAPDRREVPPPCVICLRHPRTHIILPCRHLILCGGCAAGVMALTPPLCPICRGDVDDIGEVFVA